MDTPRNRFTLMSPLLALVVGLLHLKPLNIVRVDAHGLGHERETPYRRKATLSLESLRSAAIGLQGLWRAVRAHWLFEPCCAAAALLVALLLDHRLLAAAPFIVGTTLTEAQHAGEFLAWEGGLGFKRESVTVLSGQTLKAGAVVGRVRVGIGRVSIPTVVPVGTANGTASNVFPGPEVQVGNYVVTCTAAAANAGTFSVVNPSGKALPSATVGVAYTSREINFTLNDGSSDFVVGDVFTFVVSTTAPTVIGGTGTGTISALSLGPDAKPGRYQVIAVSAVSNGGVFQVFDPNGVSIGQFTMTPGSGTATAFTSRAINFTLTDATDFIVGNYFDVAVFNNLTGGKVVAWDPTTFDGRDDVVGVLLGNVDASAGDLAGVLITRDAIVVKSSLQWGAAITAAQKESAYLDLAARGIIARDGVV